MPRGARFVNFGGIIGVGDIYNQGDKWLAAAQKSKLGIWFKVENISALFSAHNNLSDWN